MNKESTILGFMLETFREYFDLDDKQTEKEIYKIMGLVNSELYDIGASGSVVYDGVKLVLITDSKYLKESQKTNCFFNRDVSYILKKYSKRLLKYNKNYNEEEGI